MSSGVPYDRFEAGPVIGDIISITAQNFAALQPAFSYAHTISWMPTNAAITNLSSPNGMNVNVKSTSPQPNFIPTLHGIPHGPTNVWGYDGGKGWKRLDLWSTPGDGNLQTNSDSSVYDVLRHGFRVNKAGYYKLNCTLHLEPLASNRYNVAIRFGKKPAALPHVPSTTSSTGGVSRPSATDANFTLIGVPVATGYINMHNSGTKANRSESIDHIVYLDVGDEVALFTTGFGVYGPNTELFALTEFCSFQIHSM